MSTCSKSSDSGSIVYKPAGGDGVQIFTNKVYGTLVVGLRLTEAPAGMVAKNVTWAPVCIVQGPTEPKSLHDVLAAIKAFFEKHDPGITVITVLHITMNRGGGQHAFMACMARISCTAAFWPSSKAICRAGRIGAFVD